MIPAIRFVVMLTVLLFFCACGEGGSVSNDGDTEDPPDGDHESTESGDEDRTDGNPESDDEAENSLGCSDPITERVVDMAADETFFVGPYLQQPQPDSMIIKWRTESESDGRVLYGESEALGSEAIEEAAAEFHEVKLGGLKPDTRYFYKVQSGEKLSAMHHFYTAPSSGAAFRFTVWGDNHTNTVVFGKLCEQMAGFNPYFILGAGDLVQTGKNEQEWPDYLFNPARALMHETAFYSAVGSHEEDAEVMYDYYSFPAADGRPEWESMYSFSYGNAFFLVINTYTMYFPIGDIENDMSQWIRGQAESEAAKKATWRFAVAHEAGYSEGWSPGTCWFDGNQQIRGWFMPLLTENNFHAIFSGHTHGYERGMVDGLATFITGGGGGGLDQWCRDLESTAVVYYDFHHLTVEAGCNTLKIAAYNLQKEKFDWVEIKADNPGVFADEGPMAGLPDPPVNSAAPTVNDGDSATAE